MKGTSKAGATSRKWVPQALLLTACVAFTALAIACSDEPAGRAAQNDATSPAATESSQANDLRNSAPRELTPEAAALIDEIHATLQQDYEALHVVVLLNMRGEIMPCGCSDGVRGGLIKFASMAAHLKDENQPSAFLALGGNHARTMEDKQYQPFAQYYDERLKYVDRAIESLTPALKVLTEQEREFFGSMPDIDIEERLEATVTLPSGKVVRLRGAERGPSQSDDAAAETDAPSDATEPENDSEWTIIFQPQGAALENASGTAGVSFGGQAARTTSEDASGRVAVLPPPEFGGRDLAHLTLYIPKERGDVRDGARTIRSLGEVRAFRSIVERSGDEESPLIDNIATRWKKLRDDAPVLYEYERIVVALDTKDDPGQLDMYFKFQSQEGVQLDGLDSLGSGDEYVKACEPCHADVVKAFKATDPHFHAIETLKREGKERDKFCVTCHITPKFERSDEAQGFKLYAGVHCESCHVNAMSHAARPNVIKPFAVSEATCKTCHTKTQHPGFDFNKHGAHVCCNIGKEEK